MIGTVLFYSASRREPGPRVRWARATAVPAALLIGSIALAATAPVARGETQEAALDLLGSWYVLVHYRDRSTPNPEVERWEDRIWVFAKKGSRLQWTDYPIVVFGDEAGRFEELPSGRRQKVLEAWEPNEAQLQEIRGGLEINARGSRSKTLRGSARRGFQSAGQMNQQSTSVIGYSETWSIEDPSSLPVFGRRDSMGSGRTESMEGYTEYATTRVLDAGALLEGRYQRDGAREGTFRMIRGGGVTHVDDDEKRRDAP